MPVSHLSIRAALGFMAQVLIALGSNLGNAERHVRVGWRAVVGLLALRNPQLSRMFHSAPAEGVRGAAFVNAVGRGETDLPARAVLTVLQAIERSQGRDRRREGPARARSLDLDLLDWQGMQCADPNLQLPHPRLHAREFVLRPLVEVAPDFVDLRSGRSARELLLALPAGTTAGPCG